MAEELAGVGGSQETLAPTATLFQVAKYMCVSCCLL